MVEQTGGGLLQTALLGLGGLGTLAWALYEKWMRHKAQSAEIDSGVAVSNANEALFNMLTQRLSGVEEEVRIVRAELAREREYNRTLITKLVEAGITPPPPPQTI